MRNLLHPPRHPELVSGSPATARTILLLLLPLLLLATACDPCRRVQRTIAKCPAAAADTVLRMVPHFVPLPGDTLIQWLAFGDTLIVERERLRVELRTDTLTRRVWLRAECKPDTVQVQVPHVVITRHIPQRPGFWAQHGQLVALALALALVFLLAFQLLNRHR